MNILDFTGDFWASAEASRVVQRSCTQHDWLKALYTSNRPEFEKWATIDQTKILVTDFIDESTAWLPCMTDFYKNDNSAPWLAIRDNIMYGAAYLTLRGIDDQANKKKEACLIWNTNIKPEFQKPPPKQSQVNCPSAKAMICASLKLKVSDDACATAISKLTQAEKDKWNAEYKACLAKFAKQDAAEFRALMKESVNRRPVLNIQTNLANKIAAAVGVVPKAAESPKHVADKCTFAGPVDMEPFKLAFVQAKLMLQTGQQQNTANFVANFYNSDARKKCRHSLTTISKDVSSWALNEATFCAEEAKAYPKRRVATLAVLQYQMMQDCIKKNADFIPDPAIPRINARPRFPRVAPAS